MFVRFSKISVPVLLLILCAGCKEALYSDLTELEATEMVAVLAAANIESQRARDKNGVYELLVHKDDIAVSAVILKEAALPKPKFQSLGEVFSASGIIGTPFEQQARYIFAMNEELSRTVTEIGGVESARVSVNAPLVDRYNRGSTTSTASVTIHYEQGFDTQSSVTKIKQIVAHSVPNLVYDNVSVVFFPADALKIEPTQAVDVSQASDSKDAVLAQSVSTGLTLRGIALVLLAISALIAFSLLRPSGQSSQSRTGTVRPQEDTKPSERQ